MVSADPITTEVVRNFVISCAQDMNAALWRSAFSAIIYEGRDSAVALLDEQGNMLGQSTGVPLFPKSFMYPTWAQIFWRKDAKLPRSWRTWSMGRQTLSS